MKTVRAEFVVSLLAANLGLAEPIRSAKDWAIHPQLTPADWQGLVQPGNLAAARWCRPSQRPTTRTPAVTSRA